MDTREAFPQSTKFAWHDEEMIKPPPGGLGAMKGGMKVKRGGLKAGTGGKSGRAMFAGVTDPLEERRKELTNYVNDELDIIDDCTYLQISIGVRLETESI